jgi:phospholipid transport system substrate-binding protein
MISRKLTTPFMFAVALGLGVPAAIHAAPAADPAAQTIEGFDNALIQTMKKGKAAGAQGRFNTIHPAIETAFDLPAMARFAVGPGWAMIAPADQQALLTAYGRFVSASYAGNFDSYSGQSFKVLPNVQTRGVDKLVKAEMTDGNSKVAFMYRMRQSGGAWKVIDIYYNGTISQLTTQRSDFSATMASGGAKALVQKLNAQTEKLLKG